jgi:RecJ-like exonuclease
LQREKPCLVSMGIMNTGIIFRASDEANFNYHELKEFVSKKLPTAFIEGGGHKNAGTFNFLPKFKDQAVSYVEEYFRSL